jgi:hypothetical protein
MSIHHHDPAETTPAGVVAELVDRLRDALGEVLWAAQSDEVVVSVVEGLQVLVSVAAGVEAGAVVEADARGLARERRGYGSTGDWLTHTAGLRRGEGNRRLVRARALTGPLERTRRGLLEGRVSPAQADIIVDAVEDLPSQDWTRRRGERLMLTHAGRLESTDLAKTGHHLVEVVDPDAADRRLEAALEREERAAHLGRFLAVTEDRAGGVRVRGRGSAEDGALLRAALLSLTCPAPATGPGVDGATGEPCERPHDPRAYGTRLWDALVATAQHALDTDLPPQTHGARPRLLVTLDHDTLLAGLGARGAATTVDGLDLPAGVIRRLACDADLIPAVLGGHGEVLDVGRTQRLVTPAIWTALVLRDRHCTFPGCTRPPLMCHAHHLTHWLAGGTTSLHNLALLCGHHHRTIYHTLANTTQPRRQATRVPPTTQTPHRTTMDPISTTKGMSARRITAQRMHVLFRPGKEARCSTRCRTAGRCRGRVRGEAGPRSRRRRRACPRPRSRSRAAR